MRRLSFTIETPLCALCGALRPESAQVASDTEAQAHRSRPQVQAMRLVPRHSLFPTRVDRRRRPSRQDAKGAKKQTFSSLRLLRLPACPAFRERLGCLRHRGAGVLGSTALGLCGRRAHAKACTPTRGRRYGSESGLTMPQPPKPPRGGCGFSRDDPGGGPAMPDSSPGFGRGVSGPPVGGCANDSRPRWRWSRPGRNPRAPPGSVAHSLRCAGRARPGAKPGRHSACCVLAPGSWPW